MALTTNAKIFKLMELRDVKLKALDANDAPTGEAIDVPGAMKITISPKIDTKKLYGDSELQDVYSKVTEIEVDVESSLFSLDDLAVVTGGSTTSGGAAGAVAGAKTFTVTTNFVADDTLTVGGDTFLASATLTDSDHFKVGLTIADTIANIEDALNANGTVHSIYTISSTSTTFTLTETVAGGGHTPANAVVVGTGVVTSGTATTSVAGTVSSYTYAMTSANVTPPYFYIEGRWTYVNSEAGDAHVKLYKVKCTDAPSFEVNDASGNFGSVTFKASALPSKDPANAGKWFDLVINQTASEIS